MDLKSFINKNEGAEFVKESVVEDVVEIKLEELENDSSTKKVVNEKTELKEDFYQTLEQLELHLKMELQQN